MSINLNQMATMAISFVILAIIIGIGGTVLDEVQDTQTSASIAYNATESGLEGIVTFGDW